MPVPFVSGHDAAAFAGGGPAAAVCPGPAGQAKAADAGIAAAGDAAAARAAAEAGRRARLLDLRRLQSFAVQQRQLRLPILAAVALVALVVSRQAPWPFVLAWAALAVAVREWRAAWLARLAADATASVTRRLERLVLANAVLGASQGLAACFMAWLDTTHAALLTAIFLGWTAGATATSAPLPRAYAAYAAAILGPLALAWVLFAPGALGVIVALLVALTTGAQWRFLRLNAELFEESFSMRLANETLVHELAAARDVAVAADRAKSRFLAAASHDLRQPLHALTLQVGLLEAAPGAPDAPELVRNIGALTRSLARLLDALLDISKLEAGAVAAERRPLSLHRLLEHLARGHEPQARGRGLALRWQCARDLTVVSDALLLERVLRNLLDNALKYTERGEVALVAAAQPDGRVAVVVSDTGRGIPAAALPRVFDEFFRVEEQRGAGGQGAPRAQGLGLGLAIVRRLAALLEVPLDLASQEGRGTTVTLRLAGAAGSAGAVGVVGAVGAVGAPVTAAAAAASVRTANGSDADAAATPAAPAPVPAAAQPARAFAGAKVLIVDDDPAVRRALRRTVERCGGRAAEAAGAGEALARLAGFDPDLVLADCRLGGGECGIEAVRRLRDRCPGLPALLVSGDTDAALRRQAGAAGLTLLPKPLTPGQLTKAVEAALAAPRTPG